VPITATTNSPKLYSKNITPNNGDDISTLMGEKKSPNGFDHPILNYVNSGEVKRRKSPAIEANMNK
jgi:hypothetical protein